MDRDRLIGVKGAKPAALPRRLSPQLPSSVAKPPPGEDWLHEIKYDGYRLLVFLDRIASPPVRFITRRGVDWTDRFAPLAEAILRLDAETALIDGEAAVLDERGAALLSRIQEALKFGRPDKVVYVAFDLIHLDGVSLEDAALIDRKEALRELLSSAPDQANLQFSDHLIGADNGRALFQRALELELEGVVSKRMSARYVQDRAQSWLKAKREDCERFEVVGYTEKTKGTLAALILAEPDETGALRVVGRVGSGLSNDWAASLRAAFAPLLAARPTVADPPKLAAASGKPYWIPPGRFTAEVAYRGRSGASDSLLQPALRKVEAQGPALRAPDAAPVRPRLVTDAALAAVRITNQDRLLFASAEDVERRRTKLDVALYYARVADWMAPDLLDRPVSFLRCKSGERADCFFQRHPFNGLPDGVEPLEDGEDRNLAIRRVEGLLGLAQFGVIEHHAWACKADRLDRPDRFVLDLDPGEGVDWPSLAAAATSLRDHLATLGFTAFVRSTGGAGLHLVCALTRRHSWEEVKRFAGALARAAAADAPGLFTTAPQVAARRGRIFLDIGRAARGASAIASYSLRAAPGLPAAVPLFWEEVSDRGQKPNFNDKNVIERINTLAKDPWAALADSAATITRKARLEAGDGD